MDPEGGPGRTGRADPALSRSNWPKMVPKWPRPRAQKPLFWDSDPGNFGRAHGVDPQKWHRCPPWVPWAQKHPLIAWVAGHFSQSSDLPAGNSQTLENSRGPGRANPALARGNWPILGQNGRCPGSKSRLFRSRDPEILPSHSESCPKCGTDVHRGCHGIKNTP